MTIVVNPHTEQEEKVLLAFLDSLKYEYEYEASKEEDVFLTKEQQKELLRRHNDFKNGKTEARLLDDVINDLERIYR